MGRQIEAEDLQKQLLAPLREHRREGNFGPEYTPSWEFISTNTVHSAQAWHNNTMRIHGETLNEYLQKRGFGGPEGKWPTSDEETKQSLDYFDNSLKNRAKHADSTIGTVRSAINKAYEGIKEKELDIELLDLGRHNSGKEKRQNTQYMISIIDYFEDKLIEDTVLNYVNYLDKYYNIVKNKHRVDSNPVEDACDEYDWKRTESDPEPLTADQINRLWRTLKTVDESPTEQVNLIEWKAYMEVLIVFHVGAGPRTNEVEDLDPVEQLQFGDDPHVVYKERKNLRRKVGPERVPIMFGEDYLRAYRDYIKKTDNPRKLVPSPQSESGSRVADTLNSWLSYLAEIAGVELEDGSSPRWKNFRQFWTTNYKKAVHQNRDMIDFVSDEKGTDNPQVDYEHYIDNETNRKHIRELGRRRFSEVFEINELPELLQQELEQSRYIPEQTELADFN
jgi:hypothetical protein